MAQGIAPRSSPSRTLTQPDRVEVHIDHGVPEGVALEQILLLGGTRMVQVLLPQGSLAAALCLRCFRDDPVVGRPSCPLSAATSRTSGQTAESRRRAGLFFVNQSARIYFVLTHLEITCPSSVSLRRA